MVMFIKSDCLTAINATLKSFNLQHKSNVGGNKILGLHHIKPVQSIEFKLT